MMKNLEPMTGPRQPVFGSDMKNHEENFIVRMWLLVKPVRKLVEYVVKMMNLMNLRTDRINCRIVIGLERPLIDRLNDAIGKEKISWQRKLALRRAMSAKVLSKP